MYKNGFNFCFIQVKRLSKLGGSTYKENTRRILTRLIGHDLALQYNWAGKKGWKNVEMDKKAFGQLTICKIVISEFAVKILLTLDINSLFVH